ncbi:MAG TPA: hypothetical protein PKO06_22380, partial [Candidatus Ozemobacteraceae bacterium]|nr:hypothetical protein [Candidatus Ozemobacteraceae bacterium]
MMKKRQRIHWSAHERALLLTGWLMLVVSCGLWWSPVVLSAEPNSAADPMGALRQGSAAEDPLSVLKRQQLGDSGVTAPGGESGPPPDLASGMTDIDLSPLSEPESPLPPLSAEERRVWFERQGEQAQLMEQDLRDRLRDIADELKKEEPVLRQFGPTGATETKALMMWYRWSGRFLNSRRLDLWSLIWAGNSPVPLITLVAAGWG